ncbi:MAG: lysophospholipid acyltransferase family protein [Thermoplasmatota archaeon]
MPATAPAKGTRHPAPAGVDDKLVAQLLPLLRALRGYARLRVEGLSHVPRRGPALLAANHTGWLGLDYALAALVCHDERGRLPRGLVHKAWFLARPTADFAAKVGLSQVGKEAMVDLLEKGHLVMVFPEGEKGAFRPASGYQVEEFARGFVRVAMAEGVPVVPVAILGGEEANPVGKTMDGYESFLKLRLPLPANLWPKPVKWRIRFLPPRTFPKRDLTRRAAVHAAAKSVQDEVQAALTDLKRLRGHPYL